jgi:Sulfocyanin (SoxE) domain
MSGNPPDRTQMRRPPNNSRPSATPRRHTDNGPPVAAAPGWYVVRRKSRVPVLFARLLRRRRRFGIVTVATTAGVAVLVLLLSLVRAHWGEAPAERSAAILITPVASSPGAGPDQPPAASAEAPAVGATPEPDAPIEKQGGPRGASAIAASRAKADPAPHEETAALLLVSRQTLDGLTPEWQSPSRPPASVGRSQAQVDSTQSRAQVSSEASLQSPSSPQAAAGPARHGSTAKPRVAGEVFALEDRPALSPGEIRVFIHHVANHHGVAAVAERLADQLRRQGFTVADIRPVDFTIGKPSVRYFFEDDRSASKRLVEELTWFFEEGTSLAPDHASDFTHYLPKPRPGTVEVWLPASPLAATLPPIATPATAAVERLVPAWMTVDAGAHKVSMDVVAGFNPNNSNWNFNGYYDGDMTVVVPEGWQVEMTLTDRDGAVPHSLVVVADPAGDDLPLQAGREQAAFARAYSRNPEQGISARDQDTISFKADETGEFLWFCGVPGHGQSGMWTRFAVTGDAETPYITITADAEPGRG